MNYTEVLTIISSMVVPVARPRIIIDEINDETEKLLEDLWANSNAEFIVSGTDMTKLNAVNSRIVNRSNSLGRWRVVSGAQVLNEPAELLIYYREKTDDQLKFYQAKQKYPFQTT